MLFRSLTVKALLIERTRHETATALACRFPVLSVFSAARDKAYDFMEFVENVEEIANLDPDKCKPNEADEKAKKALKSVQDSVSLSHLVPNSKVCHQEPEVLLVKEDLVGCHTQTV